MGDPINLESSANRCEAGSAAFSESDSATIQIEARVCRGNSFQDATPLPQVPLLVCELEYSPPPLVCVADDEGAAAVAAKARAVTTDTAGTVTPDCPSNEHMPACPDRLENAQGPIWKKYAGLPTVFHCGFDMVVADCKPDSDHLQQECSYKAGDLVKGAYGAKKGDYVDIDWRCAGTPNADDASEDSFRHIFSTGGIIDAGWTGFVGSIVHADRQQHELENETDPPDSNEGK